jgi:hypothetical protein
VAAAGAAPLLTLAPTVLRAEQADAATPKFRFFTPHEGAVIAAAAARLVPGPNDDPQEKLYNSPGATEAGVVHYIDTMLAAFSFNPPRIFAGGPWSNRHGGRVDHMKDFVPLAPRHRWAWRRRIPQLQKAYRDAVKQLDAASSGKDFSKASASEQDQILTSNGAVRDLIFGNTIEGMYAVPEYGGNHNEVGWKDVSWPGDIQPRGYTAQETERNDGEDVLVVTPLLQAVLDHLPMAARRMHLRGRNDV